MVLISSLSVTPVSVLSWPMVSVWRNMTLRDFTSISVSVSICHAPSLFLSKQLVDVTLRQAGLSHIIRVVQCDTVGLRGMKMVWSMSTYMIFFFL